MNLIQQITNDPRQKQTLILPDGSSMDFVIEYKPQQLGWFIVNLTYKLFSVGNIRIVTSPNILHQFKNQIPFGIACFVTENQEPTTLQDFATGRATLFMLTADEVLFYSEVLSGQVST